VRRRSIVFIIGLVVTATTVSVVGPAHANVVPAAAVLGANPSSGLVDFQPVQVTGTGFPASTILEIFECRGGAVDEFGCDPTNAFIVDTDPTGAVNTTFYVDARIYVQGGTEEVDCRTDPAGCILGVGFVVDADQAATVPISFDPSAPLRPPVSATVTPDRNLVDGQTVLVHGEHLSPREETFAFVCTPGTAQIGERCDFDKLVRGGPAPDGSIDLQLAVRSRFTAPFGPIVDCTTAPGCVVLVSWGLALTPDRTALVPVTFAPPPSAPPPPPLVLAPQFTG
jgi:Neocarzinostatin family